MSYQDPEKSGTRTIGVNLELLMDLLRNGNGGPGWEILESGVPEQAELVGAYCTDRVVHLVIRSEKLEPLPNPLEPMTPIIKSHHIPLLVAHDTSSPPIGRLIGSEMWFDPPLEAKYLEFGCGVQALEEELLEDGTRLVKRARILEISYEPGPRPAPASGGAE